MGLWRKRGAGGACAACLLAASLSLAACAARRPYGGPASGASLGPSPRLSKRARRLQNRGCRDQALLATASWAARRPGRRGWFPQHEADEDVALASTTHPDASSAADGALHASATRAVPRRDRACGRFRSCARFPRPLSRREPASRATGRDAGQVPHLYQWDERWGYTVYGGAAFASTGCCPTALCMVYQGLTGKGDLTPYDMGLRAQEGGFVTEGGGTDAAFTGAAGALFGPGLHRALRERREPACRACLPARWWSANMAPGDFTATGHYIVATGLDAEGQVVVNDPFSAERSARTWPVGDRRRAGHRVPRVRPRVSAGRPAAKPEALSARSTSVGHVAARRCRPCGPRATWACRVPASALVGSVTSHRRGMPRGTMAA